jgi:hypothetical protein
VSEIQILAPDRSLSNFIPNLMRLVADAREAGLQIVYAHGLNEHSFDDVSTIRTNGSGDDESYFLGGGILALISMSFFALRTVISSQPVTAVRWIYGN